MTTKVIKNFEVAGHLFSLEFPATLSVGHALDAYLPFERKGEARQALFALQVECVESLDLPSADKLVRRFGEESPYIWVFRCGERDVFGFSTVDERPGCLMRAVSGDFRQSVLYLPAGASPRDFRFAVDNALMLLYAIHTAALDTLLVHASVIRRGGEGYAFLGRSGTGKSTHSRLWLEHIGGSELLNDDNPVVRIREGQAWICGSPWSGKTPCYRDEQVRLAAIVRLSQALCNDMKRLGGVQAYAAVLPACSCVKWEREMTDGVHRAIEKLVGLCPCFHLACRPDEAAARLCFETAGGKP